jgi:DNA-binding XRE family transcriptional regulator
MTPNDLKTWRGRFDLTQETAAQLLGIGLGTYQRYESEPHDHVLPRCLTAAVFGVTQAKLIADRLLIGAVYPKEGPTWKLDAMQKVTPWHIVDQLLDNGKLRDPEAVNISNQQHRGLVVRLSNRCAFPGRRPSLPVVAARRPSGRPPGTALGVPSDPPRG